MARLLRPGGVILLVEPDFVPRVEGLAADGSGDTGLHGWLTFWETYRACLRGQGIDTTVPRRLIDLLAETQAFENIVVQDCDVPVGFWPDGEWFEFKSLRKIRVLRVPKVRIYIHSQWVNFSGWTMNYFCPRLNPCFSLLVFLKVT